MTTSSRPTKGARRISRGSGGAWPRGLASADAILDHLDEVVYLVSVDPAAPLESAVEYVSRQAELITGYTPGELRRDPELWSSLVHPGDRQVVWESQQRILLSRQPLTREYRIRDRRSGEYRWVEDRVIPWQDPSGRLLGLLGAARDMTERRRLEGILSGVASAVSSRTGDSFLREVVERLAEVLSLENVLVGKLRHGTEDAIVTAALSSDGRVRENIEYALAGTPCGEVVARGTTCTYAAGVAARFPASPFLIDHGIDGFCGTPLVGSDGKLLGVLAVMSRRPLRDPPLVESVLRIFAGRVAAEMEREEALEALRESEQRYRVLFEEASDCIFVLDDGGAVLDVNRRLCEMVGLPREKLLGLQAQTLLVPDSEGRLPETASLGLGVGEVVTVERRIYRSDGTAFDAELSVRRIEPGRVLAITRDISERKRAEKELRQLSAKLLQLQDEERRRIARELHDGTGQVLTGLALTLDALVRTACLDQATRRALDKAKELAEQCTRDIRTLSYLLHPPMLDEAGLRAALGWLVEGFADRSGIATSLSMTQEVGRLPHDVEMALFRVAQESLANVHRHSHSGTAGVSVSAGPGEVVLEVVDHGRGIPRGDLARAMNRGVGIAGMRERLRELGGRLDIESNRRGTTVCAVVPVPAPGT